MKRLFIALLLSFVPNLWAADFFNVLDKSLYPTTFGTSGQCWVSNGAGVAPGWSTCGAGGGGTVTTFSCVTANGISCSVANPTTTPAATFTLGAITPTTVNGNTITTGSGTLSLGAGKTATISNTLAMTGTDSSSIAFGTGGTVLYSGGALGTPSSGVGTNLTGTAAGFTAGNVTTIPTLSGDVTNSGNAITVTKVNGQTLCNLTGTPAAGDLSYWTGSCTQALFTPTTGLLNMNAGAAPTIYAGSAITAGQFVTAISAVGAATGQTLSAKNAQTATYQFTVADFNSYKTVTVASGTWTGTLVASGTQPADGKYIRLINYGSGVVTIARSGQNINGGTSSITVPAGSATAPSSVWVMSDGTDYFAFITVPPALANVTGLGANVATFLGTPSSANLLAALTDETGSGSAVFGTAPTISNPTISNPVITGSAVTFTSGTSRTIANASEIIVCTSTCTVTPPGTLTAGGQFCVRNDTNSATVITLAAVTNIVYEATSRLTSGSANKSMTSGGVATDQICMVAVSTTKYEVFSSTGTWTNTP